MVNLWLLTFMTSFREAENPGVVISFFAFHFLYYAGLTIAFGGTPAKLALKMRVMSAFGERPEPATVLFRYLVYCLTMAVPLGLIISFGFLLNDGDRRSIHDRLARTLVCRLP